MAFGQKMVSILNPTTALQAKHERNEIDRVLLVEFEFKN